MNIRHILVAAGSAVAISALASSAFASGTVNATANASVTVVSATTLTKTQDMVFGTVVRPQTGTTTVSLDTSDHVTVAGGTGASVIASPIACMPPSAGELRKSAKAFGTLCFVASS